MRAIVQSSFGDPSVLELAEVPRPEPAGPEVLVRVHVARTFPLAEAAAAHELGERGEIGGGKLVLVP